MPSFPKSLQQPFRKNKLVVGAGWRAYFMPYNYAIGSAVASTLFGPTIVDLTQGPFDSYLPPFNMADLGWIKDFKITVDSKIGQVRSGYRGAIRAQYRGQVGESFECKFNEYGRMQVKLACGTNVFNIFSASGLSGGGLGPLTASGAPSANVTAYNPGSPVGWGLATGQTTPPTLTLATIPQLSQIYPGSWIVADQDYTVGQFGIIGDAGVPVYQNAVTDVDYIRKTSDYVARVVSISGNVLTLDQPFVGGGSGSPAPNFNPATGFVSFTNPQVRCQAIKGFAAREGGTFIGEWTCLLQMNTVDTAQLVVYYPHISIAQNRDYANAWTIENAGTTDESGFQLDSQFNALAFDDPLDGETVVSYRAYFLKPLEGIAI